MKFFALREKGTKRYMPQLSGRGYTHVGFKPAGLPRLFMSAHDAQVALTWYVRGPVSVSKGYGYNGDTHEYDETWTFPKESDARDASKYEVVPFELSEIISEQESNNPTT